MKRTGKNNLIYLMALILVIIAFIAFATYGMLDGSKDEEWYPVSVIVENSSSDRFTSFREGLERGAEDYHIRLNVVSTGAFSGIEEEYQIIHREIDNGAKGVIVENVQIKLDVNVGDNIIITSGPFESFIGIVEEVNTERQKVKVTVSMFGRDTGVELDFVQIKRI